jgi:ribosome production factor 2
MADLARLKPGEVTRLTRLNPDAAPFDPPGSTGVSAVEALARKADAGLFVLGSHTKKRPHALTVGRLFDGRLLDAVEFGVDPEATRLLRSFGSAPAAAQAGHKPGLAFVGSAFEAVPAAAAARSLLLDLLRGRVVPAINLAGVDRLILVVAEGGGGGEGAAQPSTSSSASAPPVRLSLRQFALRLKKSGGRTPRVEATEIGPALDLVLRRHLPGPPDLVKAALKAAAGPAKKKVRVLAVFFRFPSKKTAVTTFCTIQISDTSCLTRHRRV